MVKPQQSYSTGTSAKITISHFRNYSLLLNIGLQSEL